MKKYSSQQSKNIEKEMSHGKLWQHTNHIIAYRAIKETIQNLKDFSQGKKLGRLKISFLKTEGRR